jgi:N-sulfoglucosamine sulfohydrolase
MTQTHMTRREFMQAGAGAAGAVAAGLLDPRTTRAAAGTARRPRGKRPNILFAIADDWSWPHAGAYGDKVVRTPTFDRIAREGVRFTHTYCAAPSCSPSRASVLTGQMFWRLEEAANLWSTLPAKFPVYTEILAASGYHVGYTRKGWGPGNVQAGGRTENPAGKRYRDFGAFLAARPEGKPLCFWYGSHEPHRGYRTGSGVRSGKKIADVRVPPFLPDSPAVRSDILDYYVEVEQFDGQVGGLLRLLERAGELDNTLVVMTSDNGMPFPRAKSNLYEYGTRMPLAARWPGRARGGRVVDDFVSFTDFAPTFLAAAGCRIPPQMTGRSFLDLLASDKQGRIDPKRGRVFVGKERHTDRRSGGVGYPCRALRTPEHLYIRNFKPDRWPAGDPPGYGDIDGSPSKSFLLDRRDEPKVRDLFELACGKRPAEELYDLRKDPFQLVNVAADARYAAARRKLSDELTDYLRQTRDPRVVGGGEKFDGYRYYGRRPPTPRT